jgi:hypothetical protein
MKLIDFTKPGGFPLTQDQLNYLQQGYEECLNALALSGADGVVPFRISGMDISNPTTGEYIVTGGWLFYDGHLVRFTSGSVTGASGGAEAYVVIATTTSPLVFNDGSTPNVISDMEATLQVLPVGTATDSTHFALSALKPFGFGFGKANREATWNTLSVSTAAIDGGVSGTVYYKKDFTANTLQIRGTLSAANAQNFAGSPGTLFYLTATLPVGYRPAHTGYFTAQYFAGGTVLDNVGVDWIRQVNCSVNFAGQVFVNWVKPDSIIAAYGINFNAILPLD